jgi:hypothetical protein
LLTFGTFGVVGIPGVVFVCGFVEGSSINSIVYTNNTIKTNKKQLAPRPPQPGEAHTEPEVKALKQTIKHN